MPTPSFCSPSSCPAPPLLPPRPSPSALVLGLLRFSSVSIRVQVLRRCLACSYFHAFTRCCHTCSLFSYVFVGRVLYRPVVVFSVLAQSFPEDLPPLGRHSLELPRSALGLYSFFSNASATARSYIGIRGGLLAWKRVTLRPD